MKASAIVLQIAAFSLLISRGQAVSAFEGDASKPAGNQPGSGAVPMVNTTPAESLPGWLGLGGQIRGRFEDPSGPSLLKDSRNAYYLSRIRLDLGIRPTSWLRFFVEAQDARVGDYNSAPAPSSIYNPIDLRQGYVELHAGGAISFRFRAGRQELLLGGERLIGPADWGMSRSFDALDLTLQRRHAKVDLFAGSVVQIDPERFDRHKPGEHVYGAYGSLQNVVGYVCR